MAGDVPRETSEFREAFGLRLVAAMRRMGLKNPDVAAKVGRHTGTVSKWRTGEQIPEDPEISQLAELLQMSVSELLYGETAAPARVSEASIGGYARRRLPPPVYEVVFGFLERMRTKGCSQEQIDEAERLMGDFAYAQLHADPKRTKTIEDQIADVEAAWHAVRESIERQSGKSL